ncbi:hypothetical protein D3OALGA1CA_11 [Olavius algarvensis associated proteobacterium Delta 3]|nr:hypothetical protein D3OALGA1CA_11 [Olavius algarvensis associated proteobacterium Delta 3]CAB5099340.1 hypothetical protein D3OALGB2SA_1725 [Olavius algarvensis associated proteobacterium Delta 3]
MNALCAISANVGIPFLSASLCAYERSGIIGVGIDFEYGLPVSIPIPGLACGFGTVF